MHKWLGYPVLAVGLAVAAETFYPATSATTDAPWVDQVSIAQIAAPHAAQAVAPSPAAPRVAPEPAPALAPPPLAKFFPASRTAPTVTHDVTVSAWRTAVVSFDGVRDQAAVTSATASSPADRHELARQIQRELRRVGCYWGEIDGSWGGGSKRALASFMDRVNASLPMREPDYILLALLKAQTAAVCTLPCPAGQSAASNGRCVPDAILASRKATPPGPKVAEGVPEPQLAWTAEVRPSAGSTQSFAPTAPLVGRMSIGGPRPDPAFADNLPPNGRASPPARTAALERGAGEASLERSATDATGYVPVLETEAQHPAIQADVAVLSPEEMALPPAVTAPPRVTKIKPARRVVSRSRSVHQLFMHPLGRM